MRKQIAIGITSAIVGFGLLSTAFADEDNRSEQRQERFVNKMAKYLELTDAQKMQVADLMDEHQDERMEKMKLMREVRQQISQLDPTAADYDKQLDGLVLQAQQQLGESIRDKAEQRQELAKILTDEQQQKLAEMKQKRGEYGGKRSFGKGGCNHS